LSRSLCGKVPVALNQTFDHQKHEAAKVLVELWILVSIQIDFTVSHFSK
jgi:hypothetical protein